MNPYLKFVEEIEKGVASAATYRASGKTPAQESASKVLLFSPHPDDECITGLLPLRLMRELGKQIINVPVTFGSNPTRQVERAQELSQACAYLGWDNHLASENHRPLEGPDIVRVLKDQQPDIIFLPHENDWNSRHIATHHLVTDALKAMPSGFSCRVVETEFWGAMTDPNLMIEGSVELVADLVAATSFHLGEVARNPYHLRLPAWMQDNVRRGAELVGGQGEEAPNFSFATLYRLRKWVAGDFLPETETASVIPVGAQHLEEIFHGSHY